MDSRTRNVLTILTAALTVAAAIISAVSDGSIILKAIGVAGLLAVIVLLLLLIAILQFGRIRRLFVRHPIISRLSVLLFLPAYSVLLTLFNFELRIEVSLSIALLMCTVLLSLFVLERFKIESSFSTHYLGEFPDDLSVLVEITESARDSIEILTDLFAYGAFSAPELHETLVQALLTRTRKDRNLRVRWSAYTDEVAESSVSLQLGLARLAADKAAEMAFLRGPAMQKYLNYYRGEKRPENVEEFMRGVLHTRNRSARKRLSEIGCKIQDLVSLPLPIHAWVVDDRVAVFSLMVRNGSGHREYTFLTRDPILLKTLGELMATYTGSDR